MAFSINTPIGDGSTTQFAVNFVNGIFSRDNVTVFVDGELDGLGDPVPRTFTWLSDGLIELDGTAPADGTVIRIRRIMAKDNPIVDYEDGEILIEATLDRSNDQLLNLIQELFDGFGFESVQTAINMNGNVITNLGESLLDSSVVTRRQLLDAAATEGGSLVREDLASGSAGSGAALVSMAGGPSVENAIRALRSENLLWQGGLKVWQRGLSFNSFPSRKGVADGWSYARASFAEESRVIQQAGDSQTHSIKVMREFGDTGTQALNLVANISVNRSVSLAGKKATVSFRYKTGVGFSAATLTCSVRHSTISTEQTITLASGQYSSSDVFTGSVSPAANSEWAYATLTVDVPVNAQQVLVRFQYVPVGTAAANDYFQIEDVVLVEGVFAPRNYHDNYNNSLRQAKTEYFSTYPYGVNAGVKTKEGALKIVANGPEAVSAATGFNVVLPEEMRAFPTVGIFSPLLGFAGRIHNETSGSDVLSEADNIGTRSFSIKPSNLLGIYEESTFVPALVGATITMSSQIGRATRNGNLQFIDMEIEYTGLDTTDTSDIQINGFPDAVEGTSGSFSINLQTSTGAQFLLTDYVVPTLYANGITLALTAADGSNWDYNAGKLAAAGKLVLSGSYLVDSNNAANEYSVHIIAEARL